MLPFYINIEVYAASPKSTLIVESGGATVAPNSTLPLIDGFSKTWTIKSQYGWKVYSPDARIIKVYINRDRNNSKTGITINALSPDNRLNPGSNPGYTYITISELTTNTSRTFFVQVKPHVNAIHLSASTTTITSGEKLKLSAMTRPMNFVGVSGHGKITWSSSNTSIATVNQNGIVSFKLPGTVVIKVTYSDYKHASVSTSLNFAVGSPPSKLSVKDKNTQNQINASNKLAIFEGISKNWIVNSYKGWDISSPNLGIINLNWNHETDTVSFTGAKPGITTITITEKYTGKRKIYTIEVLEKVKEVSIKNKASVGRAKVLGNEFTLSSETKPVNYVGRSGYGSITWSSSNENIARVDPKTGKVKCNNIGLERNSIYNSNIYGRK